MARTEEQTAADDALTAAIERVAHAYQVLDNGDMLGDYVVLVATQELDGDGEVRHSYINLVRNGSVASTSAVGLMEIAAFDIKARRTEPDD
jgi:hypothetical protein